MVMTLLFALDQSKECQASFCSRISQRKDKEQRHQTSWLWSSSCEGAGTETLEVSFLLLHLNLVISSPEE